MWAYKERGIVMIIGRDNHIVIEVFNEEEWKESIRMKKLPPTAEMIEAKKQGKMTGDLFDIIVVPDGEGSHSQVSNNLKPIFKLDVYGETIKRNGRELSIKIGGFTDGTYQRKGETKKT